MHPDKDERILGSLAHASIIANIFNLAGIIASTLIWATQRERSRFVRAHSLQALAYQGAVLLITVALTLLWALCLALSLIPAALRPELYADGGPPAGFWVALLAFGLPLGFAALTTIYGLYGAYCVYRGRPFRYPLVGRLVRSDLDDLTSPASPSVTETQSAPIPPVTTPPTQPTPPTPPAATTIPPTATTTTETPIPPAATTTPSTPPVTETPQRDVSPATPPATPPAMPPAIPPLAMPPPDASASPPDDSAASTTPTQDTAPMSPSTSHPDTLTSMPLSASDTSPESSPPSRTETGR